MLREHCGPLLKDTTHVPSHSTLADDIKSAALENIAALCAGVVDTLRTQANDINDSGRENSPALHRILALTFDSQKYISLTCYL